MFFRSLCCRAAIVLCVLSGLSATAQQFVTPVNVKINNSGVSPKSFGTILGVADFNGDGRKDILGLYLYSEYALLLRQSDGSYTPLLTGIKVGGDGPFSETAHVADVNGDGRADIIILTSAERDDHGTVIGNNELTVYLGNGNGTFHSLPPVLIPASTLIDAPSASLDLVADLNHDGKPDIIVDNTVDLPALMLPLYQRSYRVLMNQGNGKFVVGLSLPVTGTSSLSQGDFNGDGFADLVVPTSSGMQIFVNHGGTSFSAAAIYPIDEASVAVVDLNGDHKPDLVAFDSGANPSQHLGHILLGNGDATFRTGNTFPYFPGPTTDGLRIATPGPATVTDTNGDGIPDIALRILIINDQPDITDLQIYPNNGDGTVGFPNVFHVDGEPFFMVTPPTIADFNNDGKPELMIDQFAPEFLPSEGYAIAANNGKGMFKAPRESTVYLPSSITSGDFNRDGKTDIAVVNRSAPQPAKGVLLVYPGTRAGYFNAPTTYSIDMPFGVVAAGDINGDGKLDLVVTRSALHLVGQNSAGKTDLCVLLGNGNGTFQTAKNYTLLGAPRPLDTDNFAALADVNHDGKLDLVGDWGVAIGKGDGTFHSPIPLPSQIQGVSQMAIGDYNRDGKPDLIVGSSTASSTPAALYSLLGNGTGSFVVNGQQNFAGINLLGPITLADLNGDGKLDLLYVEGTSASQFHVRLGNGNGTFAAATDYALTQREGDDFFSLLVADFNRDGKQDVLLFEPFATGFNISAGGSLTLLPGIGGGKFSATPQYFPLTLEQGVVLNLDADTAPDVAGISLTGITRLLNSGSTTTVTH